MQGYLNYFINIRSKNSGQLAKDSRSEITSKYFLLFIKFYYLFWHVCINLPLHKYLNVLCDREWIKVKKIDRELQLNFKFSSFLSNNDELMWPGLQSFLTGQVPKEQCAQIPLWTEGPTQDPRVWVRTCIVKNGGAWGWIAELPTSMASFFSLTYRHPSSWDQCCGDPCMGLDTGWPTYSAYKHHRQLSQRRRWKIWTYQHLVGPSSVQFSHSVMSNSLGPHGLCTSGFPVHHQLPELAQTHVHWVGDIIQQFHPLSSPSPFDLSLFQHQGLFQWVTSGGHSIGVSTSASVLPVYIQDWFPLGLTGLISLQSKGLSRVFSNTTVQKHQFFGAQLSL